MCGDTGNFSECGGISVPEPLPPQDHTAPRRPEQYRSLLGAGGLVRLQVAAEAGSQLVVRSAGRVVGTATATGALQVISFSAPTGRHTYLTTATDVAGNRSSVSEVTVTSDATPPVAEDVVVEEGDPEDARSHVLFRTDPGTRYRIHVDDEPVARGVSQDGLVERWPALGNGSHRVDIDLFDQVGNRRLLRYPLRISIRSLQPALARLSESNQSEQAFELQGSPGAKATLRVGDVPVKRLTLRRGSREVSFQLSDGDYSSAVLRLVDEFGRKGRATVDGFVVDTLVPTFAATEISAKTAAGLLAFVIAGEPDSSMTWRVLDDAGTTIKTGSFIASDVETTVELDVEKGDYDIVVTAEDASGNASTETIRLAVADDPLTIGTIVKTLALPLLALSIAGILIWLWWRNRHRLRAWRVRRRAEAEKRAVERQHAAAVTAYEARVEAYQAALRQHQRDDAQWRGRREDLTTLIELARTHAGSEAHAPGRTKLRRGERVYASVRGRLVDTRTHQGVARLAVVDEGLFSVTSTRLVFEGSKKREWAFDKTETLHHEDQARTIISVTNRKSPSGVEYSDPERSRLFVDLAWADFRGSRPDVVDAMERRLRNHDGHRPQAPQHPGEPPRRPEALTAEPVGPPSAAARRSTTHLKPPGSP